MDATDLSTLHDFAGYGAGDALSGADWFGDSEILEDAGSYSDALGDFDWTPIDDILQADPLELSDAGEFAASELAEYPPHFLEGLNGFKYYPEAHPDFPGRLGELDLQTGKISLFDHQDIIDGTLHHEMGHQVISLYPKLLDDIGSFLEASPIVGHFDDLDMSEYSPDDRPHEFVAETFAFFQNQPDLLRKVDPSLYNAWANWWQTHAATA